MPLLGAVAAEVVQTRHYSPRGPYASDGTVQESSPESSEQFVGNLQVSPGRAFGSGVVIEQECAALHGRAAAAKTSEGFIDEMTAFAQQK
jgi:hypothetical protein